MKKHIIMSLLLVAACGGGQKPKSGLGGGGSDAVPEPPSVTAGKGEQKKVEFSRDARKDYEAAAAFFAENEKGGWNEAACRGAAEKFASVAREHKIVEAQYMVGRSYHACGMASDAEAAYQAALKINSNHAPSISNLGELYYANGKRDGAKKYWETAVKADPKIVAARANLAMLLIEQLRVTKSDNEWKRMEKEARDHLSSVLAVENSHQKAYVLYGMLYMEGRQKNKNRLDLAKLLLDEGAKINEKYAPLQHAYGMYYLYRNNLTEALSRFQAAVDLDGKFVEARMNVGIIKLGFRKYDDAKEQFSQVLSLQSKNYDALIGLGVAQRGLGDLDAAEGSYKKAKEIEPKRGEAYYNLGVLYKDFRAAKESDLRASQTAYRTAAGYFRDFLSKDGGKEEDRDEAKANIEDCEKVVKQLEEFIKAQANQPPPPPAEPEKKQ